MHSESPFASSCNNETTADVLKRELTIEEPPNSARNYAEPSGSQSTQPNIESGCDSASNTDTVKRVMSNKTETQKQREKTITNAAREQESGDELVELDSHFIEYRAAALIQENSIFPEANSPSPTHLTVQETNSSISYTPKKKHEIKLKFVWNETDFRNAFVHHLSELGRLSGTADKLIIQSKENEVTIRKLVYLQAVVLWFHLFVVMCERYLLIGVKEINQFEPQL